MIVRLILIFVQAIFPGAWLSEINADSYKVHDAHEKGKVCTYMCIFLFWISCYDWFNLKFEEKLSIGLDVVFAEVG